MRYSWVRRKPGSHVLDVCCTTRCAFGETNVFGFPQKNSPFVFSQNSICPARRPRRKRRNRKWTGTGRRARIRRRRTENWTGTRKRKTSFRSAAEAEAATMTADYTLWTADVINNKMVGHRLRNVRRRRSKVAASGTTKANRGPAAKVPASGFGPPAGP